LCADGFIIRAQAAIRADGFRPRRFCDGLRAARANRVQIFRIETVRKIRTRFLGKPDAPAS
jgi:hypothetical protein